MRSSLPVRFIVIGLLTAGLTGCHTSGQWTSRHWSTSAWNPGTWNMGTRPEAPPAPSLAGTSKYPARPSASSSPTALAGSNASKAADTAPPFGGYPSTSNTLANDLSSPASRQSYPPSGASSSSMAGSPYVAPQTEPYSSPTTNWSRMPEAPPRMQPADPAAYAGSPGAVGNPYRSPSAGSSYPYDSSAGNQGLPVAAAAPYAGNPMGSSADANAYQNSLTASRANQAAPYSATQAAPYSPPATASSFSPIDQMPAAPTAPTFGSTNDQASLPPAPYPSAGSVPASYSSPSSSGMNTMPNGNLSAYKNGAVSPATGYSPVKNGEPSATFNANSGTAPAFRPGSTCGAQPGYPAAPTDPNAAYQGGSYPNNAYPAGTTTSSAAPANNYPANNYPANNYPANNYPANNYPSNSYPPSSYPTNSYPPSSYPQSTSTGNTGDTYRRF